MSEMSMDGLGGAGPCLYRPGVQTPDYLACLRRDLDAFEGCLAGDLAAPVEHCGGWTLYDLADHLGRGNLWSAAGVTERRGDHESEPGPRDPAELARWFRGTSDVLMAALERDPSDEAWTIHPPRTVGFWRRRRCMETLVHRWDAENALGDPAPLDPSLAADGVAEVLDTMYPRQIHKGRAEAPERAVRLAASDIGQEWTLGPGEPIATLRGTAQDLFLMLWGRVSPEGPAIEWDGDRAEGLRVLDRPLVP
jgi:uncharacterized protein (TIGR03083 family)